MTLDSVKERLSTQIEDEEELDNLIYVASGILCTLKNEESIEDIPQRFDYWIYQAVVELRQRFRYGGALSYSENGYSVTFARENLSQALVGEVFPSVRFVKK